MMLQFRHGALSHRRHGPNYPFFSWFWRSGVALDSLQGQNYVALDPRGPFGWAVARRFREKTLQDNPDKPGPATTGIPLGGKPVSEDELAARSRALEERLDRKQEAREEQERPRPDNSGFAAALRLSTDFVAAILVGTAIGYGIDQLAGTAPWGMIIFLMLGFCAGVLNVLRTAGRISDPHGKTPGPAKPVDDEDE